MADGRWWPKSLRLKSQVSVKEISELEALIEDLSELDMRAFLRDLASASSLTRMSRAIRIVIRKLENKDTVNDEINLLSEKERVVWYRLVELGLSEEILDVVWRLFCMEERRISHKFYAALFEDLTYKP